MSNLKTVSVPIRYLYHVDVELVLDKAILVLGLGHGDEVKGLVEILLTQQLILQKFIEFFLSARGHISFRIYRLISYKYVR
jgi:hypothetical protein